MKRNGGFHLFVILSLLSSSLTFESCQYVGNDIDVDILKRKASLDDTSEVVSVSKDGSKYRFFSKCKYNGKIYETELNREEIGNSEDYLVLKIALAIDCLLDQQRSKVSMLESQVKHLEESRDSWEKLTNNYKEDFEKLKDITVDLKNKCGR